MRINYFDYFRGVAILLIVVGHCFNPWVIDTFPEMVIANLITGGTALFVFISGFFFHRVFYPKFQFRIFLIKKVKNVFLPYLILSSLAFILFVIVLKEPNASIDGNTNGVANSILLYGKYLWTGRILAAYWFIPFIMVIFALSPLFIKYIHLSLVTQLTIFTIWVGASILIQRPLYNLSPIHSTLYFTPIYLLGIIYAIHEEKILAFTKNKCLLLGGATVGVSMVQILRHHHYGNFHKPTILYYSGFDLMIIQKIFMIFFFLSLLKKVDGESIGVLKYLGSISFALFFLHPWFLEAFYHMPTEEYLSFVPRALIFPLKVLFVMIGSMTVATLLKKSFPKKSRFIIGY